MSPFPSGEPTRAVLQYRGDRACARATFKAARFLQPSGEALGFRAATRRASAVLCSL
jgi:hypothetical protein